MLWIVGIWHGLDYIPGLPSHKNGFTSALTVIILALFVLVSGYLMGGRTVTLDRRGLSDFYARRFLRIYPPFVIAAGLFALRGLEPIQTLAKAALLIAPLHGPTPMTLWFVSVLCLFILVTPLLLQVRDRPFWLLAATLGGTLGLAGLARTVPGVDVRLAMYFPAYCAGIGAAQGWWRAPFPVLAAAFAVGVALAWPLSNGLPTQLRAMPMAATGALLILAMAQRWEAAIPDWRIITVLGTASYFMYLLHRPVLDLVMAQHRSPAGGLALLWLVSLPLVIVLANWGQELYDRWRPGRVDTAATGAKRTAQR